MVSLYIHIPFCAQKCEYCNFYVIAGSHVTQKLIDEYVESLCVEITSWSQQCTSQVKTIYFGGGTPSSLGLDRTLRILEHIRGVFDLSDIAEISYELNPDPFDLTYQLITVLPQKFIAPRWRFSIGIQTFDDEILRRAGRGYAYNNLKGFLRELRVIKQPHHCLNLDFIAFGTQRDAARKVFFENMVASGTFDSFSLYMLELFAGSKWHSYTIPHDPLMQQLVNPDDDLVMQERTYMHDIITQSYKRYEVSNYASPGRESIHNHVYRGYEDYIGLGISASGMIGGTRYTNTQDIRAYLRHDWSGTSTILSEYDILYEQWMLGLRTSQGVMLQQYRSILRGDIDTYCDMLIQQGLITITGDRIRFTDAGMNVANHIIATTLIV